MEKSFSFPSEIRNIIFAENLVEELSDQFNFSSEVYGNVLVSVVEAVNNAIKHGNRSDNSKMVHIGWDLNNSLLSITVADEGEGFDFSIIPDPTTPENIEKPHGRGIFLMQHLADQVEFGDLGRTVKLIYKVK
jgi:serine/threonine-protein kinase RsbW